ASQEQCLDFNQIRFVPFKFRQRIECAFDVNWGNNGFRPGVKRSPVEQKSQRGKVGCTMLLCARKRDGIGKKQIDESGLLLYVDAFEGACKPDEFGRRILACNEPWHFWR